MVLCGREPVGAAVGDGPEDRSLSGGRLGGPAVMRGRKPRMPFRCEGDDANDACVLSALADLVRDVRLIGHERSGDGPERVKGRCSGCDLS